MSNSILKIFIGPKSDHCLVLSLLPSVSSVVETWLMWPWRVKIHATFPSLTSCRQYWQPCCWRWNKTKAILLMPKQNKTHAVYARWEQKLFVDAGAKQKLFCQCHFLFQNKQRPCCWCRMETKAILLMSEQLKGHIPFICHFFTQTKFLENKIYTEKTRKLRQNTQ